MALTLNQTPSTDNEAVFLLRIAAEGNNLISNSTFTVDETWTKGGDWTIGSGVATYTYVDDATGNLDIAIEAAEAVEYILEYTVTAVSAGTFDIYLRGGAGLFAPATIILDKTLGKHSITFTGQASETTFGIGASGFSAGESISIDDVKVRKREDPIFISTRDITLSPNTFDGQILSWNQLSDLASFADAEIGGGIGAVTSFNFSISRHTSNSRTSSFFNEFFPAYDGGMVIARDVQFGIVWDTGTPDYTNVTWLMKGRVINYQIEPRKINLVVLQETEFDARELPYYSIQKDNDNGVSYYPHAPEDSMGSTIPILYGDLAYVTNLMLQLVKVSPGLLVDVPTNKYIFASHKCDTDAGNSVVYKYLNDMDLYMPIGSTGGTLVNNDISHTISLKTGASDTLLGTLYIPLNSLSDFTQETAIENIIDRDITNYGIITPGERLALKTSEIGSTSQIGNLGVSSNDVVVWFNISSDDAGARDFTINFYNQTLPVPALGFGSPSTVTGTSFTGFGFSFGTSTTGKKDATIPWTIEEICNLDFYISNDEAGAGDDIRVQIAFLTLSNIIVSGYSTSYKRTLIQEGLTDAPKWAWVAINPRTVRVGGDRNVGRRRDNTAIDVSGVFGYVKGREFGRWIDHILSADASKNRTTGYIEGDLIENPIYIIESIFRDEIFVERDLQILSISTSLIFACPDVISKQDDYYNFAEFFNATTLLKRNIVVYTAATNEFVINAADGAMLAGDNFFLTNVQGDYKIDYASFDVIGNTTNGKRNGWKFVKPINSKQSLQSIINDLLFESHCILFESADEDGGYSKIKVKALDKITGAPEFGTWVSPLKAIEGGRIEQVKNSLTDLAGVFTSFELFYHYDVGKGDYLKSILVDKNGYSNPSGGTTLTDEHKNLCAFAEKTYRITKSFTYSSNWIYDDATAEYFLDKKIRWFTEQRLKVKWTTPVYLSGAFNYLSYEIGDQGFITYAQGLPDGYAYAGSTAASHKFMITGKQIITNPQGTPYIIFDLIDMGI